MRENCESGINLPISELRYSTPVFVGMLKSKNVKD